MKLFINGILITPNELQCIQHLESDAEAWLTSVIAEKAERRRDALIEEWLPTLYADDSVTKLPVNSDDLAKLILARSDYRTRAQQDKAMDPVINTSTTQKDKYNRVIRSGSAVTLFSSGITIPDLSGNCILAYVQNLEEWVIGALMGQVNRGKKKMIDKYIPIILADASVTTMAATEDGLITMIVARPDYSKIEVSID